MAVTKKKVSARERARVARARADAARVERDQRVETAAAVFIAASDERAKLVDRIAELTDAIGAVEARMGAQVIVLSELGEPAAWQRELLDVEESERKRLRALADAGPVPRLPQAGPVATSVPAATAMGAGAGPLDARGESSPAA